MGSGLGCGLRTAEVAFLAPAHNGGVPTMGTKCVPTMVADDGSHDGKPQGTHVVGILRQYRAGPHGALIEGRHLGASDPYYEWWANSTLKDSDFYMHFCSTAPARCKDVDCATRNPPLRHTSPASQLRRG